MPLNPDGRRARARLAAHRRWHPGDDLDQLTEECYRELEISRIDEQIDELIAAAPKMTEEQASRIELLLRHPCEADGCTHRINFYATFCWRHAPR